MFSNLANTFDDPFINTFTLKDNSLVNLIANVTGLTILPQHAHEIIFSCLFYFTIHFMSMIFSPILFKQYSSLKPSKKHGFDAHIVSHVNAFVMCIMSFPLFFTTNMPTLTSYTPYAGLTVAVTVGYFIWDLIVTLYYYKYNGFGFLVHALAALYTFTQAMRPFMLAYAAPFMWFEASTPFVNINWFGTHVPNLVPSSVRTINGLVLLVVFFFCRIVSGPISGYKFFSDVWESAPPEVPAFVVFTILLAYLSMIGLNFLWFYKMLRILTKMIKGSGKNIHKEYSSDPVLPIEENHRVRRRVVS